MDFINSVFVIWTDLLLWLVGLAVFFMAMERLFPCNPGQKILREGTITDILYFFISPIFYRVGYVIFLGAGVFFVFLGKPPENVLDYMKEGYGPLAEMPVWLQTAVMFLVSDFLLYWIHRGVHGKTLWNFHAIHHSPRVLDWLSTHRFHPVNTWLAFTTVNVVMMLIGFSPLAAAALSEFNMIFSSLVHANLNWSYGPFKYIIASPVFHRWHHTAPDEGGNKNFAPTFPLLDIMFGTFYMPDDKRPEHYGVVGSKIPNGFAGQLAWPFGKKS